MKEPYYKGYIASYEQYLASSPYVREVMTRLAPHLDDARSMLDIGAGTGALCLSLPKGIAVTAVESSPAMCDVLSSRAREMGKCVRIVHDAWETAEVGGAYDIVLCANAVYRMEPLADSLAKMVRASNGVLFIVMNGRMSVGIYGKMRKALKDNGIPCGDTPRVHALAEVKRALDMLGISYAEERACWQDVRRFDSREEATVYLMGRFSAPEEYRAQAQDVLMPYMTETERGYCIADDTEMAFLIIRAK